MKFMVITKYSSQIIEASDIEEAIKLSYDDHTAYDDILCVVAINNEQIRDGD